MKKFSRFFAAFLAIVFILALLGGILTFGAEETKVIIHYKLLDDKEWNIWAWSEGSEGKVFEFKTEDDYGKVAEVVIPGKHNKIGFIVRTDSWEKYGGDRFIETNKGNEVWVLDEKNHSYVLPSLMKPAINEAEISGLKEIKVKFNMPMEYENIKDKVKLKEGIVTKVNQGNDDKTIVIETKEEIKIDGINEVIIEGYENKALVPGAVVRTKEFDEKYYYDGPLGATYTKEKTSITLWAPTAMNVILNVYDGFEPDGRVLETLKMDRGDKGTWNIELNGGKKNLVYDYTLLFSDGQVVNSQDPYSLAVTINGDRTVVLDPNDGKIDDFNRMPSFKSNTEAIIYEVHVRDFSIGKESGIKNKGKFLGLVESGTKNENGSSTGLDYLKELGITHVQLLPIYDYASVDERKNDEYNWGYDPKNYNVPEGSYSSDAKNPVTRIKELKSTIKGLHDNNIRVIMDVVYNHVYDVNSSALHKTVPGYYFRYTKDGSLYNGTGVGNDTASERLMMRRMIVDSCLYWMKEYNLDGFRFDLMGIHDVKTMEEVEKKIHEIDPGFIILGEGWDLNTGLPLAEKTIQKNAAKVPNIAFFNDSIRDSIKGSVFENKDRGFISGEKYIEHILGLNVLGGGKLPSALATYRNPGQVIQYAEAHDNLTMYDKLLASDPKDDENTRRLKHRLGTSLILLSQGVPFIHGGQEFLRTKDGDHNSYKSGDKVNQYDWNRIDREKDSLDYFKGLIELRKSSKLFTLDTFEEIDKHGTILNAKDNLLVVSLKDEKEEYILIFNGSNKEKEVTIGEGTFVVISDGKKVDLKSQNKISGPTIKVTPFTSTVLKKVTN